MPCVSIRQSIHLSRFLPIYPYVEVSFFSISEHVYLSIYQSIRLHVYRLTYLRTSSQRVHRLIWLETSWKWSGHVFICTMPISWKTSSPRASLLTWHVTHAALPAKISCIILRPRTKKIKSSTALSSNFIDCQSWNERT